MHKFKTAASKISELNKVNISYYVHTLGTGPSFEWEKRIYSFKLPLKCPE
jgi:hypothetical protein